VAQDVGPEFKSQYCKQTKNKNKKNLHVFEKNLKYIAGSNKKITIGV
jgi:hypothetical protein